MRRWEMMYCDAATAASPNTDESEERPSSSMMTGKGITTVHSRLSTREAIMERDDNRILVSTTRMV